ncbi:F-type H+-transporting ATPase subunit b [Sphingobium sp. B2D3A]|uniref:F0F1 ATP synthase subunit B family protein n=1 Tax=Sphingobium TaxID=165695 RepID=UPI0015EB3AF5|nr:MULTISPECIES: ATPase [Sphingobium]MCW2338328.1 F-type H+-transporting ATPase subunit b [Sphingobium sp. B2D3A]MCW2350201.1 F-type H+-transporting ATPase subunit b [Sphingobium sp. B12D2B]MCW2361562.1 F-type H+-transporting ATPase subunit b [Sphingobium sp. B10D3B]MCW2366641.1 F-type H+-transporting ATPase subunit b [Sphingobium sp. B7D2B]MCW2369305.1 F-type H+-transporting ATPase subunit b [Sphingobium sp. B11D3D]
MPQIAQLAATYSSQIFWVLLTFGFVFFVIGRGMVPKIQSTVDARDKKIADDLEAARANSAKADALEADWRAKENEARAAAQGRLAQAKAEAARNREAALAKTDAALSEKLAAAEGEIEAGRVKALAQIETVAADAAADIVQKVAGTQVSPDAALKAVKAVL